MVLGVRTRDRNMKSADDDSMLVEMGTSAFCKAAGVSQTTARNLELRGVISPRRTASGWRIYTQEDLAAVREWMSHTK